MKKLLLFLPMLAASVGVFSQTGADCNNAITLIGSPAINYTDYFLTGSATDFWFKFKADSIHTTVLTRKPPGAKSTAVFKNLVVFSGTCSGLTSIAQDSVSMTNDTLPVVQIHSLVPGQTYYVRFRSYPCTSCSLPRGFSIAVKNEFSTFGNNTNCISVQTCAQNMAFNGDFENGPAIPNNTYPLSPPPTTFFNYTAYNPGFNNLFCQYTIANSGCPPFLTNANPFVNVNVTDHTPNNNGNYFMYVDGPVISCDSVPNVPKRV